MQTFAQTTESDIFAPAAVQFTGTLAADAQLRTKVIDNHHSVPVLCFDLINVGTTHMSLHAEQIYTEATRKKAEQQLTKYKRGAQITLTSDMADMRLVLPHIQSVELV